MATHSTVLLVDDEPRILSSLSRLLHRENLKIITAGSGEEGLEQIAKTPVDLVISDQRMPGMNGMDFLRQVKKLCPDAVRIILSGYSDVDGLNKAINTGEIYRFISKPWNDDELRDVIRHCLGKA